MRPSTLDRFRAMDIATVSYMIDNPFGTRRDRGWRLYMKNIPQYDLHVVQRDKNVLDYTSRGARDVIKIQTAYEPTLHFPPPAGWSDGNRDREVSFVGTPYDDRANVLGRLWRECGFTVAVSGSAKLWGRAMQSDVFKATFRDGELYRDDYRERHLAIADQSKFPYPLKSRRVCPQELRDRRLRRLSLGRALRRTSPALQGR